jgi:hypothetical protein
MTQQIPTIGRQVHYRGKLGLQAPRTATIIGTLVSIDPRGVEQDPRLALSSPDHVHLFVFTPSDRGFFVEYNVPMGDGPGEWSFPLFAQLAAVSTAVESTRDLTSAQAYERAADALVEARNKTVDRDTAWVLMHLAEQWIKLAEALAGRGR